MTFQYYIISALGFLTQLFPCMVLSLLPFDPSSFRYRRSYILAGICAYGVLTAAAFPFVMNSPMLKLFKDMPSFGSVYMLAAVLLFLVGYGHLVRVQNIKKILCINLVVFYAATQYLLVNLILPQLTDNVYYTVYEPIQLLLYLGSTAILFPVTAWLLTHWMRPYLNEIEPENLKLGFGVIIGISLLAFFTMVFYSVTVPVQDRSFFWVFCPPFLLVTVVMLAYYWLMFRESIRRKRESEYLRYAKIQDIQYQKLRRDIENAARMRHDARHHYRVLYEMASENKDKEAQAYLSGLLDQVAQKETERYCENQTINALLQYYIGWAKDENIRCEVQALCGELAISSIDLSAVLGNSIENAIHACQKVQTDRWLRVKLGIVGGAFAVQVENACGGVTLQSGYSVDTLLPAEAFRSESAGGGYGLKNISLTAKRYGGEAQFYYDEKTQTFTTRVRMNPLKNADDGRLL